MQLVYKFKPDTSGLVPRTTAEWGEMCAVLVCVVLMCTVECSSCMRGGKQVLARDSVLLRGVREGT